MKPIKTSLLLTLGIFMVLSLDMMPGKQSTDGINYPASGKVEALEFKPPAAVGLVDKIPVGFDEIMLAVGAAPSELEGLHYIFYQESSFCATKWENSHDCPEDYPGDKYSVYDTTKGYGICQATPAIKYESEGEDWRTNEFTQARWCLKYARSYGSIADAVSFKKCLGSCYSKRTLTNVYKGTPWF